MKLQLLSLFLLFTICSFSFAQNLPIPRNVMASYTRGTRSHDGSPGKAYWQNSADYKLDINFNPVTRLLSGTVDINYYNNSNDTLKQVIFKLYPNLYQKGAVRARSIDPDDLTDGVKIDSMWINGKALDPARLLIDGTNMTVNRQLISPKGKIQFRITYQYILNKGSHIRTGEVDSGSHFVAYFFPRVAVYDDIDGWNRFAYNGSQEFYNDFCNFEAWINVPQNTVVWATGELQNCNEVLRPEYCNRIRQAESVDEVVNIIDTTDHRLSITVPNATNRWHFKASQVTDFVFAMSDHYIWKSTSLVVDSMSGRRSRVDAVFNPKHQDYFEVVDDARATLKNMSFVFPKWPFPYSHATVFDGLDQMEYPMMFNDNPVEDRHESIELTVHEIFHTMFPFYVGTNETKYGWMDEGWATLGEWLISPMIDSTVVNEYGVQPYNSNAANELDVPIITLTTQQSGTSMFLNSYPKPAFGYLYVKGMLGDSLFTRALHYYIDQWKGKHPIPYDFFNCINKASGKNLNWFWKKWFFETGYPDLSITSVTERLKGYNVLITSIGNRPVPIDLTITYVDKSTSKIHRSIEVWEKGNTSVSINVPATKRIEQITLGSTYAADANKKDNIYIVTRPK